MAFKAQRTAVSTAVVRALERCVEPDRRLFDDLFARPLCGRFLGTLLALFALRPVREWAFRRTEQRAPGVLGVLLCRFAYLDDVLRDALADGVRSVVILGAGLDSRACRVPGAEEARVIEVDHPSVQDVKKTRLRRHLGRLPSHVRFVPLDFETQDLAAELAAAGFDPTARTLFLCEGVSQYITRDGPPRHAAIRGRQRARKPAGLQLRAAALHRRPLGLPRAGGSVGRRLQAVTIRYGRAACIRGTSPTSSPASRSASARRWGPPSTSPATWSRGGGPWACARSSASSWPRCGGRRCRRERVDLPTACTAFLTAPHS